MADSDKPAAHEIEVLELWNLFVNDQGYYEGTTDDIAEELGWDKAKVNREIMWIRKNPTAYGMTIPNVGGGEGASEWRFVYTDGSEVLDRHTQISIVKGQLTMNRAALTGGRIRLSLADAVLNLPDLSEETHDRWRKWRNLQQNLVDNYDDLMNITHKELAELSEEG